MDLLPQYILALGPTLLSLCAIVYVARVDNHDILVWAIRIGAGFGFFFFVFFTAPWVYSSDYLRYILFAAMALAVLFAYFRRRSPDEEGEEPAFPRFTLAIFGVFSALNGWLLSAYFPFEDRVSLRFPLADGMYAVAQGGGNPLSNPLHALQHNPYAFDIVMINEWRAHANSLVPKSLIDYYIFDQTVFTPCDGVVKETRDNELDHPPGGWSRIFETNLGNYVRMQCDNAEVLIAHLRLGSVIVVEGEKVRAGMPLGRVGSSGDALEPRLHIAATRYGRPAGISFNRRILVTNSTFSASAKSAR